MHWSWLLWNRLIPGLAGFVFMGVNRTSSDLFGAMAEKNFLTVYRHLHGEKTKWNSSYLRLDRLVYEGTGEGEMAA